MWKAHSATVSLALLLVIFAVPSLAASNGYVVQVANNSVLRTWTSYDLPVVRDGYASPGDGGRGDYTHTTSACPLNAGRGDDGSQVQDAAGTGCWLLDPPEQITPQLFGGSPKATDAENCRAFRKAFAASPIVHVVVPGNYKISCPVAPGTTNGGGLIGLGPRTTALIQTNPALPVVKVNDNSAFCTVRGFALYHNGKPTVGGDGFDSGSNTGSCIHEDLFANANFVGFDLRSTNYGIVRNLNAELSVSHGFDISNTASLGAAGNPVQWIYEHTISTSNGGAGYNFHVNVGPGAAGMILNPLDGLYTFNNGEQGVRFLGSSGNPIQDIRLLGGFFGTDALQEIYVDSYGQSIVIEGGMAEINKRSNHADAVFLTSNNITPTIRNMEISTPAARGIHSYALGTTAINNKVYFGSGVSMGGTRYIAYNGIQLEGAYSQVSGGMVYGFNYGVDLVGANSKVSASTMQVGNTRAGPRLCGTCATN